jgi:hypothetical protein
MGRVWSSLNFRTSSAGPRPGGWNSDQLICRGAELCRGFVQFGRGARGYGDASASGEQGPSKAKRQAVNKFIRTTGAFVFILRYIKAPVGSFKRRQRSAE